MSVIRLVDRLVAGVGGRREVVVTWTAPGQRERSARVFIDFSVPSGLAEKLRWYLEDYGEFQAEPAPVIAADAEAILVRLGTELFAKVFGTGDAADIWADVTTNGLNHVRFEVDADPADVPGVPWELIRESAAHRPIALTAAQFVRTHREGAVRASMQRPDHARLRVLLVIARPDGEDDVPFRSVASRLVRDGTDRLPELDLDVLRPATFDRLTHVLRRAVDDGQPYDVVHFDGHGDYLDIADLLAQDSVAEDADSQDTPRDAGGASALPVGVPSAGPLRPGRRGYVLFENPTSGSNQQLVDGSTLAGLLIETEVAVLVLNSCRSAYAEALAEPESHDPLSNDAGDRVRAYGSFASEVASAGVPGVVAMRYNVYVETAAQFVSELYLQLRATGSLGRAATAARAVLYDDTQRHIGGVPVDVHDWVVPTVYESEPLALQFRAGSSREAPANAAVPRGGLRPADPTERVPGPPDFGHLGRDATLLALDRAFDDHRIVLLHAFAGAGKSSTAAEFARWYSTTGALGHLRVGGGPVMWTSFEHHLSLGRVLDLVGRNLEEDFETQGIHWSAVADAGERKGLVMKVLANKPVLWIWDNIEPVTGFPDGTPSAWTPEEQSELLNFLQELKTRTQAKVLLTSRRPEHAWLGSLSERIALPPMPIRERLQLAQALTLHIAPGSPGGTGRQTIDWQELVRFTGGNPLAITVAVRQALREDVSTTEQADAFTARLRAGQAPLEDDSDAVLGRDRSLAASLSYGFSHAFTEPEQARLASLHLFRDTVDVDVLRLLGDRETCGVDAVAALAGLQSGELSELLDRAAEVGLMAHTGHGCYSIHPALPWYFGTIFTLHVGTPESRSAQSSARAYCHAVADQANRLADQIEDGISRRTLPALRLQEPNLTHALHLARTYGLHAQVVRVLQGLRKLYTQTGRDMEWARVILDVEGDFVDLDTDQARIGQEEHYSIITEYRVKIATHLHQLDRAIDLQTMLVAWNRDLAKDFLSLPSHELDNDSRDDVRTLAVSENALGGLLTLVIREPTS